MSKNFKFLRKSVLLLAVMAMVLGQCFGMFGGVSAKAAGITAANLELTKLEWKTVPAQMLVSATDKAVLTATLKAKVDAEKADAVDLDSILGPSAVAAQGGRDLDNAGAFNVTNPSGLVVDFKEDVKKGDIITVDVTYDIEAFETGDNTGIFAVNDPAVTDFNSIKVVNIATAFKTIKVVEAPVPTVDPGTTADKLVVKAYDAKTGAVETSKTAEYGATFPAALKLYAVGTDGKVSADTTNVEIRLNSATAAVWKTVTLDNANPVFDLDTLVVENGTDTKFNLGLNKLYFTATGIAGTTFDVKVTKSVPDVTLAAAVDMPNGNNFSTNFNESVLKDQLTAGTTFTRVLLTASVAPNNNVDDTLYGYQASVDDPKADTDTTKKTTPGMVYFYDNGTLIASIPAGTVKDMTYGDATSVKYTVDAANQARLVYNAPVGTHEYTAKFVPTAKLALTAEATSSAIKAINTIPAAAQDKNLMTLTCDVNGKEVLVGTTATFTLSFDKAPGAGLVTTYLSNNTTYSGVAILNFITNATATTYTQSVVLPTAGDYEINASASCDIETDLDLATLTGDPDDKTAAFVNPYFGADDDGIDYMGINFDVSKAETETILTADKTTAEIGDKITLTVDTKAGTKSVEKGTIYLYTVDADGVWSPYITKFDLPTDNLTYEYTVNDVSIKGFAAAYYCPDWDYFDSETDVLDMTFKTVEGSLKVEALDGFKFKLAVLDKDGNVDVTADGLQIEYVLDMVANTAYQTLFGEQTIDVPTNTLTAGTYAITFKVTSPVYGVLTQTLYIDITAESQTPVALKISEGNPVNGAKLGDKFSNGSVTVKVVNPDGGVYATATGKVELFLGDVKVTEGYLTSGQITIPDTALNAPTAGKDLVLTAKYAGDGKFAASEVVGAKKYTIAKVDTQISATVVGDKLIVKVKEIPGYTYDGKLVAKVGDVVVATIDEIKAENTMTPAAASVVGTQDVVITLTGDNGVNDASYTTKYTFAAFTGWEKNEAGKWQFFKDSVAQTGWINDNGTWYFLGDDTIMVTGWKQIDGTWYFFKASGAMATGWVKDGGTWYYLKASGAMATGWIKDGNTWYFLKASGAMATGWIKDGGVWYFLKDSGAMATGWINDNGTWYYLLNSGAMATSGTYDGWTIASNGVASPAV